VKGLDEVAYVSVVPIVADIFGCSNCQSLVDSSDGTVTGREGLRDCDLRGSLTIISCGINSPNDPGVSTRIVSGGGLLPMKGIKIVPEPLEGIATIHHESTLIRPFGLGTRVWVSNTVDLQASGAQIAIKMTPTTLWNTVDALLILGSFPPTMRGTDVRPHVQTAGDRGLAETSAVELPYLIGVEPRG